MTQALKSESSHSSALFEARRVLKEEANALLKLSEHLTSTFEDAVETILSLKGRLVISGVGKSAHIARKIAATMASTGTPAFFIHPTEASHGDLGMLTRDDGILLLSNSGETAELSDMIAHAKRFSMPLMSMTGSSKNTLEAESDVALTLPSLSEACPLGLAPTTSTTAMLGLGDALAVSLLQARGFSAKDFGTFHPGGRLGQTLLRVEKLMHKGDKVPLIPAKASMKEALLEMTQKSFGCVGVLDDKENLVGIITDGDLRRCMNSDNFLNASAESIMTANPKTVSSKMLASEVIALMNNRKITTLFVLDEKGATSSKPMGIVHIHDCLRSGVS
ncbi:MAG: KpsF/GutQ family sugar-phosphate isomerase [bacterium]|nr:KpsF/GutQ family sugar-phosphate isomerase [bacterium]